MTRLRMRHEDDSPVAGLGLAGLTAGFLAGLAAGAYLAHRLGSSSGISESLRRRLRRAGKEALAGGRGSTADEDPGAEPGAPAATGDAADDEDELSASEDVLDEGVGDDWQDDDEEDGEGEDEEGDLYDAEEEGEDEFSSADPELEDRVLEAFTNDPILSERAVDIGAVRPATIELIGTVYSDDEYDYASTLTGGVPGVEKVVNRLVVREPAGGSAPADGTPPGDRGKSQSVRPSGPGVEGPPDEDTPRR
jgi:hypothetical protein